MSPPRPPPFNGYAMLRKISKAPDLNAVEKGIMNALLVFADAATGVAWPSQRLIAERSGYSLRTVRKYLPRLVEKGYLQMSSGYTPGRKGRMYRVCIEPTHITLPLHVMQASGSVGVHPTAARGADKLPREKQEQKPMEEDSEACRRVAPECSAASTEILDGGRFPELESLARYLAEAGEATRGAGVDSIRPPRPNLPPQPLPPAEPQPEPPRALQTSSGGAARLELGETAPPSIPESSTGGELLTELAPAHGVHSSSLESTTGGSSQGGGYGAAPQWLSGASDVAPEKRADKPTVVSTLRRVGVLLCMSKAAAKGVCHWTWRSLSSSELEYAAVYAEDEAIKRIGTDVTEKEWLICARRAFRWKAGDIVRGEDGPSVQRKSRHRDNGEAPVSAAPRYREVRPGPVLEMPQKSNRGLLAKMLAELEAGDG